MEGVWELNARVPSSTGYSEHNTRVTGRRNVRGDDDVFVQVSFSLACMF